MTQKSPSVWIGLCGTLVVMGALYLAATLSLLVNPKLKQMEKTTI